jgi:FKBP-type peptidyl-prolyl cis-trans isomerase
LINGTVFDSSVERGESITFALNEVIKGWTEGLQLMPEGSKYKFYIPSELAYGNQEVENIPAQSMLIFEIELLDIEIETTPEANAQFLVENATKQGITTTESGLQYEILSLGNGATPAATDTVTLHFEGTLIDGYVFDSSLERDKPITFALDQVIAGWSEALQLMPVGSKFRIFVPEQLAYGKMRIGAIAPHSTLIFELELLDCHPNLNPIVEVVEEVVEEVVADEEAIAVEVVEEEVIAEEAVVEEI